MPDRLVVGGVCRYTIHGLWTNTREVDTIVDMHIFNRGVATSREEAVTLQGALVLDRWVADFMPDLANNYSVGHVSWTDLDTVDGFVGEYEYPGGATGSEAAASTTPNVALLVHKVIGSHTRGQKPGRMYIAGLTEAAVGEDGVIAGDFAADLNTWRGNVEQEGALLDPSWESKMVVVHGAGGEAVDGVITGTYSTITNLVQDARCATMRRRLRG